MFCYQCGTQLEEGSLFCHSCGAKLPVENVSEEITDAPSTVQNNQGDVLQQKDTIIQEQNFESSSVTKDDKNDFKDSADDYMSENQKVPNISVEPDRTLENPNNSQYGQATYMKHSQVGSDNVEQIFGEDIKPYYRKEFARIASGQKAKFNWAAFIIAPFVQLYNGCTKIFCKTFLPYTIAFFLTSFINLLGVMTFNHKLTVILSVIGLIEFIYVFVMSIINGFCFNKWYYQDIISNSEKRRNRKGFWIFIAVIIVLEVMLQLVSRLVVPKYLMNYFHDYYDESYDDSDDVFDNGSIDDVDEDLSVEQSEDWAYTQSDDIKDSMVEVAQYEENAREIIIEWFSRHPLQHNFRIEFMNETVNTEDGSGIYLNYEMYWGDDEWYGSFYVNPASGDMIMDSMITATGITTVQESMDQWYLEDYWFLGEDLGGYSEPYEDDIYFLYNGYNEDGNPILEYYAENDSYGICDYDGQCLIEYDDGSETSEISIMDFAGTYAYDGSFEADDRTIDFYYLLEIGEWDGYSFSIAETWRGNMSIQDEYARAKSLIVDTLTFDIYNPDVGYETHSLTYVPANESTLGKDVIYLDGDNTMPFVRE